MTNSTSEVLTTSITQLNSDASLCTSATALLHTLGYHSDKTIELADSSPETFLGFLKQNNASITLDQEKALFTDWVSADLLFQLTNEELSGETSLFQDTEIKPSLLQSYLFFAIELDGSSAANGSYARGKLTAIARQINRLFPMPVMLLIKHPEQGADVLSIAVINRRKNKREDDKDVLGKVTIIRDISLTQPHRGHLDILNDLVFSNLKHPEKLPINNFDTLHTAWEEIFNIELLNKRFYKELANWYFWALPQVSFPNDIEEDDEKRRATGLIRLLTRLIFCWFIKEKDLIPEKLFHTTDLQKILKDFDPSSKIDSHFYQAILQNLFFATLNQRMGKDSKSVPYRQFAADEGFHKNRNTYDVNNLYRYEALFADDMETALTHFADIPFLNGGLFECLDRTEEETNKKRYIDGFSRNAKKRPSIPNHLFFSDEIKGIDLSETYGDKSRKKESVSGIIRILNRYKFTIVENTPIDQEIALDPELLGKVFENLLASYNEETKTTARKQTGSFYTPRPIVDYMVDESIKAHLSLALKKDSKMSEEDITQGLDILFAYTERTHAFTDTETDILLNAIYDCKILDPACGSGAFPMGILHKLVLILTKLDEENEKWEKIQILDAQSIKNAEDRRKKITEIVSNFKNNNDDYGRKLYLIENCLYGVDIQPIAIQISKLRFFISLVCDQKTNKNKKDNHGIRPLPNLETKFVAADTLIGLPEMDSSLLVDPRVDKIESQIEEHYHSHFSIQNRGQKLALQKKVKKLRHDLADILSESLMAPAKAQHIAEWDPFDPHASSDFFDPFWMFGKSLKEGFDLIIGNPPWGAKFSKRMKAHLKIEYSDIDSATPNSFAYFIGLAMKLSKAHVAYVLPDSILTKDYEKTRILLRENITHIDWYCNTGIPEKFRPFVHVEHDVCVTIIDKSRTSVNCHVKNHNYDPLLNMSTLYDRLLNKDLFILKNHNYSFNLKVTPKTHKTMLAMEKGTPLGQIMQCHEGIHTGNSRDILFHETKINDFCKPLFYGGRAGDKISNYVSRRAGWFVDYRSSIISKDAGYYASLRKKSIFSHPKIYITRTGSPIKAFYDKDTYASNNFFSMQVSDINKNTPDKLKAILPLILSSSANYYIRNFAAPRLGNAFIETKILHLKKIPVPSALIERSPLLGLLTDHIILSIKQGLPIITEFLESLIDACVMECYFHDHMKERDLLFMDDLAPHFTNYDPESEESSQLEFLNNLYQTLNKPDSVFRNRLLRITTDSPDLLAVIKKEGQV